MRDLASGSSGQALARYPQGWEMSFGGYFLSSPTSDLFDNVMHHDLGYAMMTNEVCSDCWTMLQNLKILNPYRRPHLVPGDAALYFLSSKISRQHCATVRDRHNGVPVLYSSFCTPFLA